MGDAYPTPQQYRIVVTGSRTWTDRLEVNRRILEGAWWLAGATLPAPPVGIRISHGDCPAGPDRFAKEWCQRRCGCWWCSIEEDPWPADWTRYGRTAGPVRNQAMMESHVFDPIHLVLAFGMPCASDGCAGRAVHGSHGTINAWNHAERLHLPRVGYWLVNDKITITDRRTRP